VRRNPGGVLEDRKGAHNVEAADRPRLRPNAGSWTRRRAFVLARRRANGGRPSAPAFWRGPRNGSSRTRLHG
jgi:hypothetical protein